jgi:hypothetical protein
VEPIVVILQTYRRTDYALRTIAAARELLHYDGLLRWYVADDGSPVEHVRAVMEALNFDICGGHSERRGYGGNANSAWERAEDTSPLSFWLEDDFVLGQPLDLTPHAYTLMDAPEVGMVRLGYIDAERLEPPHLFAGRPYHTLPREWPDTSFYAFTGHPSLRHSRYRQAYGDYPTGLGPGDTELAYAYQYRTGEGPLIVWPEGYPAAGYWHHIGEIKTETML